MNISFRRADAKNENEMRLISEKDMSIPPMYDSDFLLSEKMIGDRVKFLTETCKDDHFFDVALDSNKQIIGFHVVKKVPHFDRFAGRIDTLWVSPEHRGQGIGKALKERAESWARLMKLDHLHTWVQSNNQHMISINKSMGFEIVNYKMKKKL